MPPIAVELHAELQAFRNPAGLVLERGGSFGRKKLLGRLPPEGQPAGEGFPGPSRRSPGSEPRTAAVLVVDQGYSGDGLSYLAGLRAAGCSAPAILLATNPTPRLRGRVAAARAVLIEKPLLGDELAGALRIALQPHEAA